MVTVSKEITLNNIVKTVKNVLIIYSAFLFNINSFKPGVLFVGHRQTAKPQMRRRYGAILFAQRNFIKNEIKKIIKITPNTPKN